MSNAFVVLPTEQELFLSSNDDSKIKYYFTNIQLKVSRTGRYLN